MIVWLLQTTTLVGQEQTTPAAGQEAGALSRFFLDPIYPAWLAALFALLVLIPEVIKAWRWLRRRWATRHLPRNTQVDQDRANYTLLLDKYEGYLTLLRNLLILRSQTVHGGIAEKPKTVERFVEVRETLYSSIEKRGDEEDDMGDLQSSTFWRVATSA